VDIANWYGCTRAVCDDLSRLALCAFLLCQASAW
jgi:hypothetical protein